MSLMPPPKRAYEDIKSPGAPPTPARAAPVAPMTAPISEEVINLFEPPPSTAPAAVGRERPSGRLNQGRGWESLVTKARGKKYLLL